MQPFISTQLIWNINKLFIYIALFGFALLFAWLIKHGKKEEILKYARIIITIGVIGWLIITIWTFVNMQNLYGNGAWENMMGMMQNGMMGSWK